ncbi:MAG: PP2C family protein-serine/threonine phosphatase [Clostridia bacterium]|nr:PP2C family protein-serine/threonine phosphatase [Clostridia bacterium]
MGEENKNTNGQGRREAVDRAKSELLQAIKRKDKQTAGALMRKLKKIFLGDDVLWANEILANGMVFIVMFFLAAVLLLTLVLSGLGVYKFNVAALIPSFSVGLGLLLAGIAVYLVTKGEKHWVKYVLMILVCITIAGVYCVLGFRAAVALTIPVILSVRYLSEGFTCVIAVVSGVLMLSSTVLNAYIGVSFDLNSIPYERGWELAVTTNVKDAVAAHGFVQADYVKNLILRSFLPNVLQYIVICFICAKIAKWGHRTVIDQAEVSAEFTRIDTELKLSTGIQANMLPNIFPAFPEREEFDIHASMDPAKEVGGDFYDFFLIDHNTLGMVVADVSGKGVPAALFMMIGKTIIKNQALTGGLGAAEVLERANRQLCENNEEGLFITAWYGQLDIPSGKLTAANAGHEYPVIMKKNGDYELLKDKHGFVLAGFETTKYREYEIQLEPGDKLFLYTDGVPEAVNAQNEQFGVARMLEVLNANKACTQAELLKKVRAEIDAFVEDTPQFDDVTMLGLTYLKDRQNPQSAGETNVV